MCFFCPRVEDTPKTTLCSVTLDDQSSDFLGDAISNHYWYQLYLDDLPIWGMLGEVSAAEDFLAEQEAHKELRHAKAEESYIYTHKQFSIAFNGNRVIEVNMTNENPTLVKPDAELEFTYAASWVPTTQKFSRRFDRYLDYRSGGVGWLG